MSAYSGPGIVDFRDWLKTTCNDSFELFMEKTGGVLSQEDDDGQIQMFQVSCPCDLMKFYDNVPLQTTETSVVFSEKTALQVWFEGNADGFTAAGLENLRAVANSYPYFVSKYLLMKLYNQEHDKPKEEQVIVG